MKKIVPILFAALLTSLIPSAGFAANRVLPDTVQQAVGKIEVHSGEAFDETTLITYGSATFIDHGGCFFTNSHAVLNLNSESHEQYPYFQVLIEEQKGQDPEVAYEAEVLFVDEEVDLAYGCPKGGTRVFTNYFERFTEDRFLERSYGEEVWLGGYPQDGLDTLTIAPGHIVGFLDEPDISHFGGLPHVSQERLRLYKADSLAGPGISGGVAFTTDLKLVGIPFAGSFSPGGFVFLIGERMYQEFEEDVRAHLVAEGLVPADCIYQKDSGYYVRGGANFYDNQCEYIFDEVYEKDVRETHRLFCEEEISEDKLKSAVRRSKQLEDLTPWRELTLAQCKGVGAGSAGDFAYGKDRLSSLAEEQNLAIQLKAEIDKNYPNLKIHEDDWSTIVNSYIYGGYPVEAINKAIELGGITVHPSIPFDQWKNSEDYKKWL